MGIRIWCLELLFENLALRVIYGLLKVYHIFTFEFHIYHGCVSESGGRSSLLSLCECGWYPRYVRPGPSDPPTANLIHLIHFIPCRGGYSVSGPTLTWINSRHFFMKIFSPDSEQTFFIFLSLLYSQSTKKTLAKIVTQSEKNIL